MLTPIFKSFKTVRIEWKTERFWKESDAIISVWEGNFPALIFFESL